jgi:hypothetical protein
LADEAECESASARYPINLRVVPVVPSAASESANRARTRAGRRIVRSEVVVTPVIRSERRRDPDGERHKARSAERNSTNSHCLPARRTCPSLHQRFPFPLPLSNRVATRGVVCQRDVTLGMQSVALGKNHDRRAQMGLNKSYQPIKRLDIRKSPLSSDIVVFPTTSAPHETAFQPFSRD